MNEQTASYRHRTKLSLKRVGKQTLFEENRETKIGGLDRGVFRLVKEKEVLWLEVPVNDSHGVASMDNLDNGSQERGCSSLGVVSFGNDAIEELAAGAELHDKMNRVLVLVGAFELDDVGLAGEVVHDLHFSPNVLNVLLAR